MGHFSNSLTKSQQHTVVLVRCVSHGYCYGSFPRLTFFFFAFSLLIYCKFMDIQGLGTNDEVNKTYDQLCTV